jgi:hypothetical protein
MATTANIPTQCATALKEWATVLEAMARGEQIVLIRKGGLIEPGSGFELVAPAFVFYPTFEHQAVQYLRQPFQGYFEAASAKRAAAEQVRFELAGVAVASWRSSDPGVIERLSDFHIYNDAFTTQRLKWQPDQPLVIAAVRAFRLAQPQLLPVAPHYAGCKSWVQLDAPIPLAGASPVLDDAAFAQRLRDVTSRLSAR